MPVVETEEDLNNPGSIVAAYDRVTTLLAEGLDWAKLDAPDVLAEREKSRAAERRAERRGRFAVLIGIGAALAMIVALAAVTISPWLAAALVPAAALGMETSLSFAPSR